MAGKTTLFNLLTGVYEPSSGLIELMDQDKSIQIGGLKPYKITNLGVARTFQNIRLFKSMTVLENVKVAMHKNIRYGTLAAIFCFSYFCNPVIIIIQQHLLHNKFNSIMK